MRIETLDHVALWVADRDSLADFMTEHVGMHVIDRTDAFTIVGADARRGKLTLFAVADERDPAPLARVALRVGSLDRALAALPEAAMTDGQTFTAPCGLELELIEAEGVDYDLDHVVLQASDPDRSYAELAQLGFEANGGRLWAGDTYLRFEHGDGGDPERSLLNHLGLRVESAQRHIDEARERGLEIADVVDAANTYAVFVWGPERLKLEYVEHKASFSLV
jgi:catechol 2,3-dioxygenase-like lactoylglutathione lyase family enzyme